MAQPNEVHAFRILPPMQVDKKVLQLFDFRNEQKKVVLKPLAGHQGLDFCSVEYPKRVDFGLFSEGTCVGYVSFGKLNEPVLIELLHDLVKPHAQLLPEYRGRGITRHFYLSMLHHGYSLAAESHTAAAAQLWDSLSRELSIPILHWDKHLCVWVTKPSARTLKVLTLKADL